MVKIPRDDTMEQLAAQVRFLRAATGQYDEGDQAFAQLIALHLRVLLHHNPRSNSHALLNQVGVLDLMWFLDSGGPVTPERLGGSTLTMIEMSTAGTVRVVPRLDDGPPDSPAAGSWGPFHLWWERPVVSDTQGQQFSRGALVKAVANRDGGAHVDPQLSEAYRELSRSNSLSMFFDVGGGDEPMGNPVPAVLRQIGFEVLTSLAARFREFR